MKYRYDNTKNILLKEKRNITFDELMQEGKILNLMGNRSTLHKNQKELVVLWKQYVYSIPCVVEEDGTLFLKTAHRDRKLNDLFNKK